MVWRRVSRGAWGGLLVAWVACADPATWFKQAVSDHFGIEAECVRETGGAYNVLSNAWCYDRYRVGDTLYNDAWVHAYVHETTDRYVELPRVEPRLRVEYAKWSFRSSFVSDAHSGAVWRSVQYRLTPDVTLGYERIRGFGSAVRLKYATDTAMTINGVVARKDGDLVVQVVFLLDF